MQLRDYQQRSIDQLYDWMRHNAGNPCLVLPTGAGKADGIPEDFQRIGCKDFDIHDNLMPF